MKAQIQFLTVFAAFSFSSIGVSCVPTKNAAGNYLPVDSHHRSTPANSHSHDDLNAFGIESENEAAVTNPPVTNPISQTANTDEEGNLYS